MNSGFALNKRTSLVCSVCFFFFHVFVLCAGGGNSFGPRGATSLGGGLMVFEGRSSRCGKSGKTACLMETETFKCASGRFAFHRVPQKNKSFLGHQRGRPIWHIHFGQSV